MRRFAAGGYRVAMLARDANRLARLEQEIPDAIAVACDVRDAAELEHVIQQVAGFAPTKAAQRILAESLARDLGPKGVHVAYLVTDAVIDVPWQRERLPDADDDFFISPASIADEVFHLAHQPGMPGHSWPNYALSTNPGNES